jgi:hypothetical protein
MDETTVEEAAVRAIIGISAFVIWLTSTALADKYNDLVVKEYRWVTTDGPFACASEENALFIVKNHSDENTPTNG